MTHILERCIPQSRPDHHIDHQSDTTFSDKISKLDYHSILAPKMDNQKRRRANFNDEELTVLINEAFKRRAIVMGKFDGVVTGRKKNQAWEEITQIINTISPVGREKDEIKKKFVDFKSHVRRKEIKRKNELEKIGMPGQSEFYRGEEMTFTPIEQLMLSFLHETAVHGLDIPESETPMSPLTAIETQGFLHLDSDNVDGNDDDCNLDESVNEKGESEQNEEVPLEQVKRGKKKGKKKGKGVNLSSYASTIFKAANAKGVASEERTKLKKNSPYARHLPSMESVFSSFFAAKAEEEKDPDLLFFRGILPDIRRLSERSIRYFRADVLSSLNRLLDEQDQKQNFEQENEGDISMEEANERVVENQNQIHSPEEVTSPTGRSVDSNEQQQQHQQHQQQHLDNNPLVVGNHHHHLSHHHHLGSTNGEYHHHLSMNDSSSALKYAS